MYLNYNNTIGISSGIAVGKITRKKKSYSLPSYLSKLYKYTMYGMQKNGLYPC